MNRLCAIVGTTVVAGLVAWTPVARAQPGGASAESGAKTRRVAYASAGAIEGRVLDEQGHPVAGAMVSVLGAASAVAVTDKNGAFVMRSLPPGAYTLRTHMTGYLASARQFVDVRTASASRCAVTLQRAGTTRATPAPSAGPPPPKLPPPPKVLAAGLAPAGSRFDPFSFDPFGLLDDPSLNPDDQSETAWRLRHLPRSVLKDTTDRVARAPGKAAGLDRGQPATALARAIGAPARLLSDMPLTGQVNLVTSGSFDGGDVPWSGSALRGTAFFSLAGPVSGYGDWSARLVAQGDPGSWFVSGGFRNRTTSRNVYAVGFSYSSQHLSPVSTVGPLALERTPPLDRFAGTIYGAGRFTVTPRLLVDYGGRLAHYDYMGGSLFSPSLVVTLVPVNRIRLIAGASERQVAPGAEEFLEPANTGLWVPPERTFVAYSPLAPERTTQFDLSLEHDLAPGLTLALRSVYQSTTNQQMVFFGDAMREQPGHYGIGDAGDVVARTWSVGVTHHLLANVRGSVSYDLTEARWLPAAPGGQLLLLGFRPRPTSESLHGLATSLDTDVPFTSTHVYVAYRINSGFTLGDGDTVRPGLDSRFDVQVTQRLPFLDLTGARWQVLLAVKNVFRDSARDSSVYDELLVVKPPTRVLGGFVVRF